MIREKLKKYFSDRGFNEVNLHTPDMDLFYIPTGSSASLVWIISEDARSTMDKAAYERYYGKIKQSFQNKNFLYINTLTLFLTSECRQALSIAEGTAFWIVDEKYGRLVIYENQPDDFLGIRLAIEQFVSFLTAERIREADAIRQAEEERIRREDYMDSVRQKQYGYSGGVRFNNRADTLQRPKVDKKRPYIALVLVIINVLVLFLVNVAGKATGLSHWLDDGAVSWFNVFLDGEYYRLITCMFLHAGIDHVLGNMLALYFIGGEFERLIGHVRFLIIYFLGGIGAGLFSCSYYYWIGEYSRSIGASGAVFAIEGAYIMCYLLNKDKLTGDNRINGVGLIVYAAYALISGMTNSGIDNAAHLGGLIAGSLIYAVFYACDKFIKGKKSRRFD